MSTVSSRSDVSSAPLFGVRVLVVDDDDDMRDLIAMVLTAAGALTTESDSVPAALTCLGAVPFDVLVSDIGMPGEDGYALVRRLRASTEARLCTLPAIALTAFSRDVDRSRALGTGFNAHVAKPFEPCALVAQIRALLAT